MMPWKDQVRLAARFLRWLFWPADQKTWANITMWIVVVTILLGVIYQLWLPVLAAFLLYYVASRLGRKRG
jgi:hypothetical protein